MRNVKAARALLAAGCVLVFQTPARSDEPAPAPQQQEEYSNERLGVRVRTWYGWQTLAVDAASIGTAFAGYGANDFTGNPVSTVGILGYILGAPIVHWIHGHAGKGVIDLGLRLLAPALVGGLTYLVLLPAGQDSTGQPVTANKGAVVGLGVGCLGMVAIDASVFAFEQKYDMSGAGRAPHPSGFFASPRVQIRRDGATMGLGGIF
jgi:hypothetical protein